MGLSETEFYLDPLEGIRPYPNDRVFDCIWNLLFGAELRFAPGCTDFEPKHPLVVGNTYSFRITYYPEEIKLPPGAIIRFSIPQTWTQPQMEDSDLPGFVKVRRQTGSPSRVWFTQNENLQWWICVQVLDEEEPESGFVEVQYSNVEIQRFPQNQFINWRNSMRTIIQLAQDPEYAIVSAEKTCKPVIVSAPAGKFVVASPAIAKSSEEIEVKFCALDYCDNIAYPYPETEVFAAFPESPFSPVASVKLTAKDKGSGKLKVTLAPGKEHTRILVFDRKDRMKSLSPVIVIRDQPEAMSVYFGDIHGKTILSDGLGSPDEYYEHARDVALCDFAAITDHNYAEASRIEGPFELSMSDEAFSMIQDATERFNEPGRFVTLQGFEQNKLEGYPGHRNVYFRGQCPGLFRGNTLEELHEYLEGHDALVIPHHPVIWNTRVHLANPKYSRLVEMYSMHCSSEIKGSPLNNFRSSPGKAETGQSAQELLNTGYRVGFIAASDNHNGAPGLSARPSRFSNLVYRGGLAAVFAPELSRESIFDGLYNRNCYATTGARIYLEFRVNGLLMGSEIRIDKERRVPYEIVVGGTERVGRIEMVHNERVLPLWVFDGSDYTRLEGELEIKEDVNWVYVRVVQVDHNMAWSSPIWIDIDRII